MSQAPRGRAAWFRYTEAASLGIEMAVAIVLGAVGGYYLERHVTHWSPWTMLIGLLVGIGAAIAAVVRTVKNFHRLTASEGSELGPQEPAEGGGSGPTSRP